MTSAASDDALLALAAEHREILDAHLRAEIAFDMEGTLRTLTDDCLFEDFATGQSFRGHAGAREYYDLWWSAFRIRPAGGRLFVPDPSTLIVETRFVGTHIGPWFGMAPTGAPIDLPIAIVVTFEHGLMSGERFYYDRTTLMQQMGRL